MADKKLERWYLERLRPVLPNFPAGAVECTESPDFLIDGPDGPVGIEITVYHSQPRESGDRSHQERQSLKERAVALASRLHQERSGPALYVSVFFHEPILFDKRTVDHWAESLVRAVAESDLPSSFSEGEREVSSSSLPDGISAISVRASVDGVDQLWSADAGGYVGAVGAKQIESEVRRKERKLKAYRARCSRAWLLIVNDVFSKAAPVKLSDEVRHCAFETGFDRLLWFDAQAPAFTELSLSPRDWREADKIEHE